MYILYLIMFPGTKPRVEVCKGIRYPVYCSPRNILLIAAHQKQKTPHLFCFFGHFQLQLSRLLFFGIRIDGWLNLHRPHSHEPNHYDTDPRFNGLWALWDSPPRKKNLAKRAAGLFSWGRGGFFSRFFFWEGKGKVFILYIPIEIKWHHIVGRFDP